MNAKNHLLEIRCNLNNVKDITRALIHTIIFFRTSGKFTYRQEASYSVGTLGYEEVDCEFLEFTYVRCSSDALVQRIESSIKDFIGKLSDITRNATLRLDFYTKKPKWWPFNDETRIWESWTLKMLFDWPTNKDYKPRKNGEEMLSQKLVDILTIVNLESCSSLPRMPTKPNYEHTFDSSFDDLQPYLFSLSFEICDKADKTGEATRNNNTDNSRRSSLQKFILETLEL